ncbi:MAG TPA: NAD(P)-binding domain-containing protein [Egibacteraceae bacterium]|nr:NAD(P)-binding domain-containing protein [Egibacteraceae bacterium]
MAQLTQPPFPPGEYPAVVVGSGPGGLQVSYWLTRLGVRHAVISADRSPGGMFQRFPVFQRLITWTKLHAPAEPDSRAYERFDWNSLLALETEHRFLVRDVMNADSYFPTRDEMETGLAAFARQAGIAVRYGTAWEATRRSGDGFTLTTSDGDYRCKVAILAVGMAQPWKPPIDGLAEVPHYVEVRPIAHYADKRVLVIGKRNSGFELADGLLTQARQIILVSPRPAQISVLTHSTAAARARYLQPYEDYVLGGGTTVLDASVQRVERVERGYQVHLKGTTRPSDLLLEVDEVIAATGFAVPLGDLRQLGVATFYQNRLPAQTPFWESPTVEGIYFAGAITQGAIGLKKYGIPSNSAAVHGFRYNAEVLARHIASKHFGLHTAPRVLQAGDVVDYLLTAATQAPDLWNQQSYLARVVEFSPGEGILDRGALPLAHFADAAGPDSAAITIETDAAGDIHPALYVRRRGQVAEHLLPSDPLHDFDTQQHRAQAHAALSDLTG